MEDDERYCPNCGLVSESETDYDTPPVENSEDHPVPPEFPEPPAAVQPPEFHEPEDGRESAELPELPEPLPVSVSEIPMEEKKVDRRLLLLIGLSVVVLALAITAYWFFFIKEYDGKIEWVNHEQKEEDDSLLKQALAVQSIEKIKEDPQKVALEEKKTEAEEVKEPAEEEGEGEEQLSEEDPVDETPADEEPAAEVSAVKKYFSGSAGEIGPVSMMLDVSTLSGQCTVVRDGETVTCPVKFTMTPSGGGYNITATQYYPDGSTGKWSGKLDGGVFSGTVSGPDGSTGFHLGEN